MEKILEDNTEAKLGIGNSIWEDGLTRFNSRPLQIPTKVFHALRLVTLVLKDTLTLIANLELLLRRQIRGIVVSLFEMRRLSNINFLLTDPLML